MNSEDHSKRGCLPIIGFGLVLINSILILGLVATEWIFNDQSFGPIGLAAFSIFWCIVSIYFLSPIALICLLIPKARVAIEKENLILFITSTIILAIIVEYSEYASAAMTV